MRKQTPALLLALLLLLSGCGRLHFSAAKAPSVVYTGGDRLRDPSPNCDAYPALADRLRSAILEQQDVTLQGWDSKVVAACLDELIADPELFWVTGYHITASTGADPTAEISFRWLCEDGAEKYSEMCSVADAVLAEAPAGDYDRALYREVDAFCREFLHPRGGPVAGADTYFVFLKCDPDAVPGCRVARRFGKPEA